MPSLSSTSIEDIPYSARASSAPPAVSAMWISSGTPYSAANCADSCSSSGVVVSGEWGPTAGVTRGWSRQVSTKRRHMRQALVIALGVGGGPLHDRLGAHRPHPRLGCCLGNHVLVIVHVGKAGYAGADHLGARQQRPPPAELGADKLALHRQHIAKQPHVEPQVVGQPAQQAHRHVTVGIDQTGEDGRTLAIHHLGRLPFGRDRLRSSHGDDLAILNSNCAPGNDLAQGVHRDYQAISEQDVG